MAISIGSVSVDVVPDASKIAETVRQKVRDLKATIAVDADTTKAEAQIKKLGAGTTATVDVDVDDSSAKRQLDALTRPRTASIGIKTDTKDAEKGLAVLTKSAAGLAPALIPMAAAAAAGIGAIGPLAAAGASGIAVLTLGFSGVSGAMKLLSQQSTATGDALTKVNSQLAQVNAPTLAFAKYVQDYAKPAIEQLKAAAAGGLLPGVQSALETALPLFSKLTPFVQSLAGRMGDLFQQASKALGSPFWSEFFSTVGQSAGPLLSEFAHTLGNVAQGFAGIVQAFTPLSLQVGGGIEDLSKKFAAFGANLDNSDGFRRFTAYIQQAWPAIRDTIENVSGAVGHLVQGLAPLGGGTLLLVRELSGLLANMPVGVVTALSAAFIAFKIGGAASDGLTNLTKGAGGLVKSLESISGGGGKISGVLSSISKFGSALPIVGLGIGLVTTAVAAATSVQQAHARALQEDTDQITRLYQQQASGAANASQATQALAAKQRELNSEQQKLAQMQAEFDANPYKGATGQGQLAAIDQQKAKIGELTAALDNAKKGYQAQLDAMTPVEKAQTELNTAITLYGPASDQAKAAADRYRDAQSSASTQQERFNQAIQSTLQLHEQQASQALASLNSTLAAAQAQQNFNSQLDQYNKNVQAGSGYTGNLAADQTSLAQAAVSAAQAAAQAAADQAKQNGATDTGNVSQQAMLKSLQETAKHLTGPARDSVNQYIATLQANTVATGDVQGAVDQMGLHVQATWDQNTRVISGATDSQIKDLQNLGFNVTHLPDGKIVVTSDTGPARAQVDQLIKDYQNKQIAIAGGNFGAADARLTKAQNAGGTGYATGGPVFGPGTGTSDSIRALLSNGEHVWTAREVAAAGGHNAVAAMRKSVLPGYADGGPVFAKYPAVISQAAMQQAEAIIGKLAPAIGSGSVAGGAPSNPTGNAALGKVLAGFQGWGSGPEWNALYALWQRESGWRNTAQNPTSTAYGIPQFLNSTWGPLGYTKTSDPATQINAGLKYVRQRYGDPIRAWAHEVSAGFYDQGGLLQPGYQMVYNGTGAPELVAPQKTFEQVISGASGGSGPSSFTGELYLDSGEFVGMVRGIAQQETDGAINRAVTGANRR